MLNVIVGPALTEVEKPTPSLFNNFIAIGVDPTDGEVLCAHGDSREGAAQEFKVNWDGELGAIIEVQRA